MKGSRLGVGESRGVNAVIGLIAWLAALVFFFPVFWTVLNSFKEEQDANTSPKLLFEPTLDRYSEVIESTPGLLSFREAAINSAVIVTVSTIVVLALAIPAAYALAVKPIHKWRDVLLFFISTKFLPVVASILPLWIIAREFDLLNTRLVLMILYTAMNLPLAVWMLRSFFQEIPRELIEAAEIDGAGLRGQLSTVILPIAIPGIAATALLCVIFAWNEYFYAVQLNPAAGSTVPIWVTTNISTRGDFLAKLSAASVLASVPVVVGRLAGAEADDPRSRNGRHQVGDVVASVTFAAATRFYPGTDRAAVDSLDLQIADGELLVLVGPSGSGKSTALRMLAGLEPLDGGAVFIGDRDVTSVRPRDRDIAMVFQNYALYPQLTVAENMGFALKQKGVPKAERIVQVREAARILDLEPYLDRKPKNLSGGQRQRVAMGRAIVRHPQVYLMDEPLSNLDAKLRVQTRTELAELQSRLAVTTVYVTHDQVEAMTMGHRVAVLRDGVLQQCDTPHQLYHAPGNLFVAGFIGSPAMNLVSCARAGTSVAIGGHRLELSPDAHAALDGFEGERVVVGFRPESVAIGGDIPAVIRVVEDLGPEVFVHVAVEHEGESLSIVAKVAAPFPGIVGESVAIRIVGAVHVFDPSGTRLTTPRLGVPSVPG